MNMPLFRRRSHAIIRWGILLGILAYVTWEFYAHAHVGKVHPSVHALCPLGGLESLLRWISADGATLGKVFSGTMGLFFVAAGTALLFRRSFCGTICPLGTLQELFGSLGRKVLGQRRAHVPRGLDRILRWLKYLSLAVVVAMAWITGTLWIQAFDPWSAYGHIVSPAELFPAYAVGFGILVVSLVLSFFFERAFCRYLCPMGALTAIAGLLSPWKVRRNGASCVDCGLCDKACPVDIEVSKAGTVGDIECITCGKCAAACPAPKTLEIGLSRRLSPSPAAGLVLAAGFFFIGILVLQVFGFDRLSGQQEPTLREMASRSGMGNAAFAAAYGLPANTYPGIRASELQDRIPLARFAELNGRTAAGIKEELGLSAELPDTTPWGKAYALVSVGKVAELNGFTFEDFKERYSLPAATGPETAWGKVRKAAERAAERMAVQEAAGTTCEAEASGACEGE